MGMGYAGSYADVISEEGVKEVCPKEYQALMDAMVGIPPIEAMDFDELAQQAEYNEIENKDAEQALEVLKEAFDKKTGLALSIGYHDADEQGDRYDDINGGFWCVGGMYELTKAGKKFEKYVQRKMFVSFG